MTDVTTKPITPAADLLTLVGSRLIPTLLYKRSAPGSSLRAATALGLSAAVFHALSATLWGLFIVLINIRPAPLRRNRAPLGAVVARTSQLAVLAVGLFGASTDGGVAVLVSDVLLICGLAFA